MNWIELNETFIDFIMNISLAYYYWPLVCKDAETLITVYQGFVTQEKISDETFHFGQKLTITEFIGYFSTLRLHLVLPFTSRGARFPTQRFSKSPADSWSLNQPVRSMWSVLADEDARSSQSRDWDCGLFGRQQFSVGTAEYVTSCE